MFQFKSSVNYKKITVSLSYRYEFAAVDILGDDSTKCEWFWTSVNQP